MKKKIIVPLLFVLLVCLGLLTYSWTYTQHGRLDYWAAFSLKLLTFEREIQPDPKSSFRFKIPANLFYAISMALPKDKVFKTEDIKIPAKEFNIPARIYWPLDPKKEEEPFAAIVYYHGGGFVVGSVDIFDGLTRTLAKKTEAAVISVDYRLAPVHPYPAAVNDSYEGLLWVAKNSKRLNIDPDKIFVGGDSAGGNLSAVIAMQARDKNGPSILGQILYYPATNPGSHHTTKSFKNFVDGYGLSTESITAFNRSYIGHVKDKSHPYISPLKAPSHRGLAPALIITAGFDPLRDSGKAYAECLKKDGVRVTYVEYPRIIHGFMSINLFSQRKNGFKETVDFIRQLTSSNR